MSATAVTILIPTRNNSADLKECLKSLNETEYPHKDMDVLIFDNGSSENEIRRIESLMQEFSSGWGGIHLERSPDNLGAFGGRAEALRRWGCRGRFLLSLDDDVTLFPNALGVMIEAVENGKVGVVGARIVYHDSPEVTASGAGGFNRWLGVYSQRAPRSQTSCQFVSSCGLLARRSVVEAVGGFDPAFYTSHGDVDFCLKVIEAGYQVIWEPRAIIRHKVEEGGTRTSERLYYVYRNKFLIIRKHVPAWWRPFIFAFYGSLWLPKVFANSILHHRGLNRPELRAIALAAFDAVRDRRGAARWEF